MFRFMTRPAATCTLLAFGSLLVSASEAKAQIWKNTPFDADEWRTGFRIPRQDQGSASHTQVVTAPSIDQQGNIWSGSGSGGARGQYVRKAQLTYQNHQAFWVADYQNSYGRAQSPVRAPAHDRQMARVFWAYNGGGFQHQGNGRWVERNGRGETFNFRQVNRDANFTHLRDDSRQVDIWLGEQQCFMSVRGSNPPRPQCAGSWVR